MVHFFCTFRLWWCKLRELELNSPADKSYYLVQSGPGSGDVDNPDQRISEDISAFTASSVSLAVAVSGKVLNMGAFAGVLWGISPDLVYFLLGYSTVCVFLSIKVFGQKLTNLHFQVGPQGQLPPSPPCPPLKCHVPPRPSKERPTSGTLWYGCGTMQRPSPSTGGKRGRADPPL